MENQNLRTNKTKILLSKSLLELLETKDFYNIKVNEICNHALVHKTTFYNHFNDKYDLLNYILIEIYNGIKKEVNKNEGIIEYYLSIAKSYIKLIKTNPKLFQSMIQTSSNDLSSFMIQELYVKDVEDTISQMNIPIPSNYVARFYVSAVYSVLNEWFIKGMIEDEDTIIKYIELLIRSEK
ncbi:MAG: TetR/AcrR family transcriptional regulator [bacterium]|nr:TetR/AcrR family transcriptional regulator [bacterium]